MKNGTGRTVLYGMAAGVVATMVMDVFVAVAMIAMGNPVSFMFAFIGDVTAAYFRLIGLPLAGGAPVGALMHYLFGMGYGGLFCAILRWVPRLKPRTLGKTMLLGIAYIEIFSQPFLASAPMVLKMTATDILQWYALSTAMHAVYGAVLGALEHYRAAILKSRPLEAAA